MLGLEKPEVQKELCLNGRLRAGCKQCAESCPEQKIRWGNADDFPLFPGECSRCGRCVSACPAQAVLWPEKQRYPLHQKEGRADIFCRQKKADGYVSCLAALTAMELTFLALQMEVALVFDPAVCENCRPGAGELIQAEIKKANLFLTRLSKQPIKMHRQEIPGQKVFSRRDLFGVFFSAVRTVAVESLPLPLPDTDWRRHTVARLSALPEKLQGNGAPLFFGARADSCRFCSACVRACKKNALQLRQSETEMLLLHDSAACDGCAICSQVCSSASLEISDQCSDLSALQNGGKSVIFRQMLTLCPVCHQAMPENDGKPCVDCQRKQQKRLQDIY